MRFAVAACATWASAALVALKLATVDPITADESTVSPAPRLVDSLEDVDRDENIPSFVFDPSDSGFALRWLPVRRGLRPPSSPQSRRRSA